MIQRIQSLYLLLAIVLPVFTYIVPLGQFSQGETEFALYSCHYDAEQVAALAGRMPYGLLILSLAAIALAVVALLGFKNRVAQLKKVVVDAAQPDEGEGFQRLGGERFEQ